MAGKFEVYEDKSGKFRFRLEAGNGEVVASGQSHSTLRGAKDGCAAVQRAAEGATNAPSRRRFPHSVREFATARRLVRR